LLEFLVLVERVRNLREDTGCGSGIRVRCDLERVRTDRLRGRMLGMSVGAKDATRIGELRELVAAANSA
jgi:hypothetical protein